MPVYKIAEVVIKYSMSTNKLLREDVVAQEAYDVKNERNVILLTWIINHDKENYGLLVKNTRYKDMY